KRLNDSIREMSDEIHKLEDREDSLHHTRDDLTMELHEARSRWRGCQESFETAKTYWQVEQKRQESVKKKIRNAGRQKDFWLRQIDILTEEKAILDYCFTAF